MLVLPTLCLFSLHGLVEPDRYLTDIYVMGIHDYQIIVQTLNEVNCVGERSHCLISRKKPNRVLHQLPQRTDICSVEFLRPFLKVADSGR